MSVYYFNVSNALNSTISLARRRSHTNHQTASNRKEFMACPKHPHTHVSKPWNGAVTEAPTGTAIAVLDFVLKSKSKLRGVVAGSRKEMHELFVPGQQAAFDITTTCKKPLGVVSSCDA